MLLILQSLSEMKILRFELLNGVILFQVLFGVHEEVFIVIVYAAFI